jgi:hypothetical protein
LQEKFTENILMRSTKRTRIEKLKVGGRVVDRMLALFPSHFLYRLSAGDYCAGSR